MRKKPSATYHHGRLKEALAEAALKIIEKKGEGDLTLRGLGKATGVSHAAVYRHFRSRTDILAYLAEKGFERLEALFLERSGLVPLGRAYVEFAVANPASFRTMFHPELTDKKLYPQLAIVADRAFGHLLNAVAVGMKEGRYHGSSPMILAIVAWSSVHGLSTLFLDRQLNQDDVIDEFLYRVEKGFLSK